MGENKAYTNHLLAEVKANLSEQGTVKVLIAVAHNLASIADSLERLASRECAEDWMEGDHE